MTKAWDIVAYTFKADTYCPECIIGQLPTGEDEAFDGWGLGNGVYLSTEDNLSEIAYAFGIDREDEYSFDSGDFPKVVFSSQIEDDEYCGNCLREIDA